MSVNAVLYGATALLVVSSLGMVSIYFGNPDNEGEATVANSEITQFPPRHVLHRTHPIAPQLFDGDDAIRINDSGNEMDTSAITATSVTKGPNPLRLYAPGTRPSTPFPRIRAVPFFKKTIRVSKGLQCKNLANFRTLARRTCSVFRVISRNTI